MADYGRISKAIIKAIADALRYCNGNEAQYTPGQMPNAVRLLKKRLTQKTITRNGVYIPPSNYDGFDRVTVNVQGGDTVLVEKSITANGTYNPADDLAAGYSGVTVNVPAPPAPTLVSKNITANGEYSPSDDNADGYSSVSVAVPNTYSAADNGKVVNNGALVSQTSRVITSNGTYDTTLNNEVEVDISAGGSDEAQKLTQLLDRTISGSYENSIVTNIGSYAFYSCTRLTEVSFPSCTSIGSSAFRGCTSLTDVSFPSCLTIGSYAFCDCTRLTEASFPVCTSIGSSAFRGCTSLTDVSFPSCLTIRANAFFSCNHLTEVSFPVCTTIGEYAFYDCKYLSIIKILGSSVVSLGASNAFSYTPITNSTYLGYYGSIYVPESLYSQYLSASVWSLFSSRIVSVSITT